MTCDKLEKVINEYNEITKEKKNDWQMLLESSQIVVYLLLEELGDLKMQLNGINKSTSIKSDKYNQSNGNTFERSNFFFLLNFRSSHYKPMCFTCGKVGQKYFNCIKRSR